MILMMNPKKESDLESIASDRTLRNSGSVSSLDSYMTACEEFDYSLFPFLYRGIQNADRGKKNRYYLNLPVCDRYL